MRIGILIPVNKSIDGLFFQKFIDVLHDVLPKYDIDIYTKVGDSLDRNRNKLVNQAISRGCDYIWFIDSDHIIPKGTLDKLFKIIKDTKAEIVSGLYFNRTPPNLPVIRRLDDGLFIPILDFKGIMEVDGIGMGCCLIKTDVFIKIGFPYFEFKHENIYEFVHYISEDLNFCKKAREKGIKIYVDTDLIIPHIGGIVSDIDYLRIKNQCIKTESISNELIDDLMSFDNISKGEVRLRLSDNAVEKYKEEWDKIKPKNKIERDKFYKKSKWGKYDLAFWHLGQRADFNNSLVEMIKKKYPDKEIAILDYGCGIGQNSYLLAKAGYKNITLYDLNIDFAEFRFKKHNLYYKTKIEGKYNLILCFDVLEHLDDDDFEKTTNLFKKLIKKDGEILVTVSFGNANGLHPMHFKGNKNKMKIIRELMKNAK